MKHVKLGVDEIVVPEQRYRKDLGDLTSLCDSMAEIKLRQPIGVRESDKRLVFGFRRLAAAKKLGWETIDVVYADSVEEEIILRKAEFAENIVRKDFTPSEAVAAAADIREREEARARERKKAGGELGRRRRYEENNGECEDLASANFAEARSEESAETLAKNPSSRQSRKAIADVVGMSHDTLKKAEAVVEAAKQDPETFAKLLEDMDKSGKVNPHYKRLMEIRDEMEGNKKKINSTLIDSMVKCISCTLKEVENRGGILKMLDDKDAWDWEKFNRYTVECMGQCIQPVIELHEEMKKHVKNN